MTREESEYYDALFGEPSELMINHFQGLADRYESLNDLYSGSDLLRQDEKNEE